MVVSMRCARSAVVPLALVLALGLSGCSERARESVKDAAVALKEDTSSAAADAALATIAVGVASAASAEVAATGDSNPSGKHLRAALLAMSWDPKSGELPGTASVTVRIDGSRAVINGPFESCYEVVPRDGVFLSAPCS